MTKRGRAFLIFSAWALVAGVGALGVVSCKGSPDEGAWCSAGAPAAEKPPAGQFTYYRDIKPILDSRCTSCHVSGGLGQFALTTYEEAFAQRELIRQAVSARTMPPWLAARCCADYFRDLSLTDAQISAIVGWADQGGPGGDPAETPPPEPPLGGLSRVDATLKMKEAYTPAPPAGSTDDTRCFVIDWPYDNEVFVTGLNPIPGVRGVVHHLIVGVVGPDDADDAVARDGQDGRTGFDCGGGFGDLRDVTVLGGSLVGGDFPRGLGHKVEPGSKILLNVHYSTAHAEAAPDQTSIEVRVDEQASEFKGIAVANPLWIAGSSMAIPAGEEDAVFYYKFEPNLFTLGKAVMLQSVSPHMHYFGSKITVRVLRKNDDRQCLLEIPRWDFGWEQPYWFAEPIRLDPGDEVYVECHFDNSAKNQPAGQAPRDIAWGGNNQDMCAAFMSFTEAP